MTDRAGNVDVADTADAAGRESGLPLLERLRAQDHQAFAALMEQHYGAVHRYLARLLADPDSAAELAQETFLRAYRGLPRLAGDSNLGAWLFRIATNLARQHHRHRRLIGWSDVSRLEGQQAAGGRFEDEVAQHDLLRQALERLPLNERICLLLYGWSGYSCPEIACGTYGSSRRATSSPDRVSCSAAIASSRCSSFVAPTIGAVTPGLWSSHASET